MNDAQRVYDFFRAVVNLVHINYYKGFTSASDYVFDIKAWNPAITCLPDASADIPVLIIQLNGKHLELEQVIMNYGKSLDRLHEVPTDVMKENEEIFKVLGRWHYEYMNYLGTPKNTLEVVVRSWNILETVTRLAELKEGEDLEHIPERVSSPVREMIEVGNLYRKITYLTLLNDLVEK